MTRQQILNALDHLDDATIQLEQAFLITGDLVLIIMSDEVQLRYDELNTLLAHAPDQPALPL